MATITKRGEKWRVQIRHRGHKPVYQTFSKKAQAEQWARAKEAELDTLPGRGDDPDFGQLVQRYIDEILPLKPLQRSHAATLRTLRRQVAGVPLSKLDPAWALDFARQRDVAPSTRAQLFVFLGMVLKAADLLWSVQVNWVAWNRAKKMLAEYGLTGRSGTRNRRVTDEDVELILDHMQSSLPMDDLIYFAIDSCMRLGEIVRVRWDDLDREKKLLTIRDRKHPRKKSGNHQTIPLLGNAFNIVLRQPKFRPEIFPVDPNSVSAAFHRAVVRAGLNDLRWHDLRHEGVSRLFEKGYHIEQVALVSGHLDWHMLRRYTHLRPESLHEKAD